MLLRAPKLYFRNHCAYAGLYTFNHDIYPDTCSLKADKEGEEKQSSLGYAIPPVRCFLDQRIPIAQVSKTEVPRRG